MVDERSKSCPKCGAPISGVNRFAHEQPKTIEELKDWYIARNLPPEEITRFFIGKNITEPKAFGIYKTETGDCVVYKNKASGERAIRYQGADEAYAVNELYQRLKTEIANQKSHQPGRGPQPPMQPLSGNGSNNNALNAEKEKKRKRWGCGCLTAFIIMIFFAVGLSNDSIDNGYYKYDGTEYYHLGSSWYKYDASTDAWYETESMKDYINKDNASDYRFSGHEGALFEETSWYHDWENVGKSSSSSSYDDWDTDDDWDDDDSWSSSSTDWDDDW